MKLFIDTANYHQIIKVNELGIIDGVTTNPSLLAREKIFEVKEIYQYYELLCNQVRGDVSIEVMSNNFFDMLKEGEFIAKICSNIVIKIPMTIDGIRAIRYFASKNIKTNCTLIFSSLQALLAAKAGATYVSPFIGRLDDICTDGLSLLQEIKIIFSNYCFDTKILAASIRNPIHILSCAKIGVDVVTLPFHLIMNLYKHPLTRLGLKQFLSDFNQNIKF